MATGARINGYGMDSSVMQISQGMESLYSLMDSMAVSRVVSFAQAYCGQRFVERINCHTLLTRTCSDEYKPLIKPGHDVYFFLQHDFMSSMVITRFSQRWVKRSQNFDYFDIAPPGGLAYPDHNATIHTLISNLRPSFLL